MGLWQFGLIYPLQTLSVITFIGLQCLTFSVIKNPKNKSCNENIVKIIKKHQSNFFSVFQHKTWTGSFKHCHCLPWRCLVQQHDVRRVRGLGHPHRLPDDHTWSSGKRSLVSSDYQHWQGRVKHTIIFLLVLFRKLALKSKLRYCHQILPFKF